MKRKLRITAIFLLFLAGFSLLLYPFVANKWNNYRQKQLIGDYDNAVAAKAAAGGIDYEAEWKAARDYNEALLPSVLPDSFLKARKPEADEVYMSCLNIGGNGIMGTVEIPKIGITIPVFHTTDEELLELAAGHLEGSSLPVGGENTHAVISAHRGLPSAALFTDLDKMKEKDHFLLHVLDETLCYEVDQIIVVKPKETESLNVEEGEDLVTLMTCTPYGVNSHRLLVRGHRVPYEENAVAAEKVPFNDMSLHTNYLLWVLAGILLTALFSLFLYRREKKRLRAQAGEGERGKNQTEEPAVVPEENMAEDKAEQPEVEILAEEAVPDEIKLPVEEVLSDEMELPTEEVTLDEEELPMGEMPLYKIHEERERGSCEKED